MGMRGVQLQVSLIHYLRENNILQDINLNILHSEYTPTLAEALYSTLVLFHRPRGSSLNAPYDKEVRVVD